MAAITNRDLARIGLRVSPANFEERVRAALHSLPATPLAPTGAEELPTGEAAVLTEGGFTLRPISERDDPYLQTVADYTALVTTALTVKAAATRLGVDPSQIRRRLGQRTLYGLKIDDDWVLPAFQFSGEDGPPVRGLAEVLPQLPPTLYPAAVYRWFTRPDPDLRLRALRPATEGDEITDMALSPHDWLNAGGTAATVAALAAGLGQHG